jgi:SNF2 family DNA or RNA helicase
MLQQNSFHDLVHANRENIRKAGGTGLNLTAADYVIQMDHWWNPAAEDQAIDVLTGSDNIAR